VIPYQEDPDQMISFPDLTRSPWEREENIQENTFIINRQKTNTSIPRGWFYRDDMDQKVPSYR